MLAKRVTCAVLALLLVVPLTAQAPRLTPEKAMQYLGEAQAQARLMSEYIVTLEKQIQDLKAENESLKKQLTSCGAKP